MKEMAIKVYGGQVNIARDRATIIATQNSDNKNSVKEIDNLKDKGRKEVFLSYCWEDEGILEGIYEFLKLDKDVNLHRDKINIGPWESIREYMQSIPQMDYVILIISDAYLKSENCMYEVLEVLRDRAYQNKICPIVINAEIYKVESRAKYVLYWQHQYEELREKLQEIKIENIGRLAENLKTRQNIASNIAEFLDEIVAINNPKIVDVKEFIRYKLQEIKKQ